jgi:manganese/zinc/iron transport system permease protein
METLHDLVFDYTLRNVALGATLLGIVSGVLGAFAVLRRQGLLGDTLAHAALPGIAIAFLLTGSRETLVLLLGAGIAGWLGTLIFLRVVRDTTLSEDTALGVILSVFFGVGITLLTMIQNRNDASQAGLDRYLFGQAAALVADNVRTFAILGGVALAILFLFYKEFTLLSFDPAFAASVGLPVLRYKILAFVIAAVMGALGGALYVDFTSYANPELYAPAIIVNIFLMLFLGGKGHTLGPIVGAAIVVIAPLQIAGISDIQTIVFNLALLVLILVLPGGLLDAGSWRSLAAPLRRMRRSDVGELRTPPAAERKMESVR